MPEDDDGNITCDKCGKELEEDIDYYSCSECDDQYICKDCMLPTDNVDICKECVDKLYPRKIETVEKVVEKIVEVPQETIKVMGFSEPIL